MEKWIDELCLTLSKNYTRVILHAKGNKIHERKMYILLMMLFWLLLAVTKYGPFVYITSK